MKFRAPPTENPPCKITPCYTYQYVSQLYYLPEIPFLIYSACDENKFPIVDCRNGRAGPFKGNIPRIDRLIFILGILVRLIISQDVDILSFEFSLAEGTDRENDAAAAAPPAGAGALFSDNYLNPLIFVN